MAGKSLDREIMLVDLGLCGGKLRGGCGGGRRHSTRGKLGVAALIFKVLVVGVLLLGIDRV